MTIAAGYTIMWMFVLFDLPVTTKATRKLATQFRNELLNMGFLMHQFSVYVKRCSSREKVDTVAYKIQKIIPKNGKVNIMWITDKQFQDSIQIWQGQAMEKPPEKAENLLII
jgi:CRISPR-associated protein Cas2